MASFIEKIGYKEKIGYALGDAAAGGITWKIMSIAFPLFFTNVFGLTVADTATLMPMLSFSILPIPLTPLTTMLYGRAKHAIENAQIALPMII